MKFYNKLIGNRDYTLFEVVHFGLRLPGVLHSFGPVETVSLSNWATLKPGQAMAKAKLADRATYFSKFLTTVRNCNFPRVSRLTI